MSDAEHRAANEEALSVNEEYQSANEELLTSKEELQSLNEELTALNGQLQEALERQRTTANDLQNVLYSTKVATLFLDSELRIRFFTPATKKLFHLIPGDIGRPLADLQALAIDPMLAQDARAVLVDCTAHDCEVAAPDNSWFLRHIMPYRTDAGSVEGVVITFTDITEKKRSRAALEAAKRGAEQANLAKSRFLAATSHDLRQPLQSLALLQGLLEAKIKDPGAEDLLGRLAQTLVTMSAMLNTLPDINQIEAEMVQATPIDFVIGDLVARVCDEFTEQARAQKLVTDVAPLPRVHSPAGEPTIYIVDDDCDVRRSLRELLETNGRNVEDFGDCEAFLAAYQPGGEACLLIDAYLPGIDGIELLRQLKSAGSHLPAIMITGSSAVPMAVEAMKVGAIDFIEKPVSWPDLLASVNRALLLSRDEAKLLDWQADAVLHLKGLTPRQHQVMELVLAGHPSKNIAADLGISQRTVENHRASIMKKTGAKSLPALARLALAATGSASTA
jgi:FixJ family two-component response regulator/PAS domain-containing protein